MSNIKRRPCYAKSSMEQLVWSYLLLSTQFGPATYMQGQTWKLKLCNAIAGHKTKLIQLL